MRPLWVYANSLLPCVDFRDFQHDAVRAIEQAIADGKRQALVAMATGTGKTRTAIGLRNGQTEQA